MTHRVAELLPLPTRQPHGLRRVLVALLASNRGTLDEADEERNAGGGLGLLRLLSQHASRDGPPAVARLGHGAPLLQSRPGNDRGLDRLGASLSLRRRLHRVARARRVRALDPGLGPPP